uniref:Uncharacterized protein n=1 Tax=Glossina austeni TaxID=7395 RepID=A0A1A9VRH9_GLOAU
MVPICMLEFRSLGPQRTSGCNGLIRTGYRQKFRTNTNARRLKLRCKDNFNWSANTSKKSHMFETFARGTEFLVVVDCAGGFTGFVISFVTSKGYSKRYYDKYLKLVRKHGFYSKSGYDMNIIEFN